MQEISAGVVPQQKRRRKLTERSRLGCMTCRSVRFERLKSAPPLLTCIRVRRIKCDQKRPFCERCTSTGRRCEGPAVQGFQFVIEEASKLVRRAKPPSPLAILQPDAAPLDPCERRAFYFFIKSAAPTISGAFDTGFWSKLVPQVSHAEPAVYNALLTIGQLFDTPLRPDDPCKVALEDMPANSKRVFTWYSTAVSELQKAMNRGRQSVALALLSCLLFTCVEYQLHNAPCALLLLQRGLALLETTLDGKQDSIQYDSATSAILDSVIPFFSRHAIVSATFGQPPPPSWKIDASSFELLEHAWSSIETMDEAQVSLYSLMYQGNAFVRIVWLLNRYPTPAPSLVAGQREMEAKVDAWRVAYLKLCENMEDPKSMNCDGTLTNAYLLMYHSVLKVWVATCTSPFQTAFDAYFTIFEEILVHAEAILSTKQNDLEANSPFAVEMGLIPPLFFVATKCREPSLRRRALSLLERSPLPRGLWRVLPTIQVVRKVIDLEEEDIYTIDRRVPDEANRIHHLEIVTHTHTSAKPIKAAIRVMRVDWDTQGQRQMRDETVTLEPEQPVQLRRTTTRPLNRLPVSTPYLDNKYL
jgi:Fungal specific transcription factor domain